MRGKPLHGRRCPPDPLAHIGAKTLLLVLVMYLVHFIRRWKEFAVVCYTVMGMICLLQAVVAISTVAQIRAMVL